MPDLVISSGRLLDGRVVDVVVADGRVRALPDAGTVTPDADARVIHAAGGLVTPSFVNAHMHLDKVYTRSLVGDAATSAYTAGGMGAAMTGIELAREVKRQYRYRADALL